VECEAVANLKLLVVQVLAKLLGYSLQVGERNLAGLVGIERVKDLLQLLPGVGRAHLGRHHLEELRELDAP